MVLPLSQDAGDGQDPLWDVTILITDRVWKCWVHFLSTLRKIDPENVYFDFYVEIFFVSLLTNSFAHKHMIELGQDHSRLIELGRDNSPLMELGQDQSSRLELGQEHGSLLQLGQDHGSLIEPIKIWMKKLSGVKQRGAFVGLMCPVFSVWIQNTLNRVAGDVKTISAERIDLSS